MKKSLLLIPIFILSCSKKDVVSTTSQNQNSGVVSDQNVVDNPVESLDQGILALSENPKPKEISKTFRAIEGNKIIKTLNGDMIPLKITDHFTKDQNELILKIKNFKGEKIAGEIIPENAQMNIRFNQIKLANGNLDGPFGRDFKYEFKEEGEIWLIIGKSNMASGETTGRFTINLK